MNLRRIALLGMPALALALGACTVTPGGTPPVGIEANFVSDLQSTAALAKANNDNDAGTCDQAIITVVGEFTPILPTNGIIQPTLPPGSVKGVAYDVETAHLLAQQALNAVATLQGGVLTPTQKQQLKTGCALFVADLEFDKIEVAADLAQLFAKFAKVP